jgi:DNA-binding MarR family transcriptional regulator
MVSAVSSPDRADAAVPAAGNAFLLAQIGAYAAARFAGRITELDLTLPQAGLLRLVAWRPGRSQQDLAELLGTPASRLVRMVDDLEQRGLLERRRNTEDRRRYALYPTEQGSRFMARLARAGAEHEDAICEDLDDVDRAVLHRLLTRIAARHGLAPGVHPGYRDSAPSVDD